MMDPKKSLFILYCALNRSGYDVHDLKEFHPVRKEIRKRLFRMNINEDVENFFRKVYRPDLCQNHPYWVFICLLVNTLFLLDTDEESFQPLSSDKIYNHIAPFEDDLPLKIDNRVLDYLQKLPAMLNQFRSSIDNFNDIWDFYENNIPAESFQNYLEKDILWFKSKFRFIRNHNIEVIVNFMEREYYASFVKLPLKYVIITGPTEDYPRNAVTHEVSHVALDELIKNIEDIKQFYPIIKPYREKLEQNGYWAVDLEKACRRVISDIFCRAITYYIKERNNISFDKAIEWDRECGFAPAAEILPLLREILESPEKIDCRCIENILKKLLINKYDCLTDLS